MPRRRNHSLTFPVRAHDQKTIEGDLFQAFVAAGAISKANADDPKKSTFVRCARTDKGVHAAGNVISLKLIIEDNEIVDKINSNLTPQIRVWGYERTNNSFSAYQLCDSRIYEYLIPTHSFLPPHPSSYLGRKIEQFAREENDVDGLEERQKEVKDYWKDVDEKQIRLILDEYDERTRAILEKALYLRQNDAVIESNEPVKLASSEKNLMSAELVGPTARLEMPRAVENANDPEAKGDLLSRKSSPIGESIRRLREAFIAAKRSYRIHPARLERVRKALALYEGTRNYHNYTTQKKFSDPSAKRVIKSFVVNDNPILINGTEWLSLKVHGQSFMMHQIRKMVGMAALVVRGGCDPQRILESYGADKISIPKAPSLGLLLERPVFDSYNQRAKNDLGKEPIDFDKVKREMDEFKQREIYERMYRAEEQDNM